MSLESFKPGVSAESAPETDFVPTASEENVLSELHAKTEGHHRGEKLAPDHALLDKLHSDVEKCECFPLFKKYTGGHIPTIERMFRNTQPFLDALANEAERVRGESAGEEDPYFKEVHTLHGLLAGREQQIRGAIQRYVHSVVRFRHLQKINAGGTRDVSKQFEEADRARRRAHNSLLESLTVYAAQARFAKENGYDELAAFPFAEWEPSMNANEIDEQKAVIFGPDVMRNRDFVRDWAIVADFAEQLEILGDDEYLNSMRDRPNK